MDMPKPLEYIPIWFIILNFVRTRKLRQLTNWHFLHVLQVLHILHVLHVLHALHVPDTFQTSYSNIVKLVWRTDEKNWLCVLFQKSKAEYFLHYITSVEGKMSLHALLEKKKDLIIPFEKCVCKICKPVHLLPDYYWWESIVKLSPNPSQGCTK